VDPKHIYKAITALYLQEKGQRVRLSRDILLEAYQDAGNVEIAVMDDQIVLYLKE
jgi:hypothetical protein